MRERLAMLNKITTSLALTTLSLATINVGTTLAKPATDYADYRTLNPSECTIVLSGDKYYCDYITIGIFPNGSGNIKLCSNEYCFILILDDVAFTRAADGRRFNVDEIAWQEGRRIRYQQAARLDCILSSGVACRGNLQNGSGVAIYAE
jgi:hypothetical protein